jgi:hypothetical protein
MFTILDINFLSFEIISEYFSRLIFIFGIILDKFLPFGIISVGIHET